MKRPYDIILSRRVTEKSAMLQRLCEAKSNKSLARCETPKVVFDVHPKANKSEIKKAVEVIYASKNVKVVSVNTIVTKPKKRRVRGFSGMTAAFKKAIVSFRKGDRIEEAV